MRLITVVCILAFVGNVSAVFISTFLIKSDKEICLTINEEDNQSDLDSDVDVSDKLEKDFVVAFSLTNYFDQNTEALNQQRNYFNRSNCYLFHYQSIIDNPPEVIC
jgi:uncharacterized membrane protein YgaE (UPF0421/DUF939 family)